MSEQFPRLPARPSLEQLQKQAKELLRKHREGDRAAMERFRLAAPRIVSREAALADAQFVVAREYGFESWAKLKARVVETNESAARHYEDLARDLVSAYDGDTSALDRLNVLLGGPLGVEQLRAKLGTAGFAIDAARLFVARQYGFESWGKLLESIAQPAKARSAPHGSTHLYRIDWKENAIEPAPILSEQDWDTVIDLIKEHRITTFRAGGRMTDATLRRLADLDHLTSLDLGGSVQLSDDGLAHLARFPQLRDLDLSGWKGRITDRGLEVLRHLPALRRFKMCWQQNISDAGLANLAACEQLEEVNLMGTPAGDGVIAALAGNPRLTQLKTGRNVTDAGLPILHRYPAFKAWAGGALEYGLMSAEAGPTRVLIDGPFTDHGLASLVGLDGLFGLSFFWHSPAFTAAGLGPLKDLANLGFLGCEGERCNDEAMRHIAAMPKLRMLMGQGTVATDEGWKALSASKSIEYIWGRECPNLTGRGFAALADMPALRGIAVSCSKVDDAAPSMLPRFPALCQLMPMDVSDAGFRHVGRCERLEGLWCMYCRETGDLATEHIADLRQLRTYYAGKTLITDRSLEILGRMTSLEKLEFWQCAGVTNAGVTFLAALPRLRELTLDGLPGVTREAIALFPERVRVSYST